MAICRNIWKKLFEMSDKIKIVTVNHVSKIPSKYWYGLFTDPLEGASPEEYIVKRCQEKYGITVKKIYVLPLSDKVNQYYAQIKKAKKQERSMSR